MEQLSLIPEAGLHELKILEDEDIYVDTAKDRQSMCI